MIESETIVYVAARGEGVTADGRHAALAAPGDRLLRDGTVLPGPHRIIPPCRHFPVCGGCQLQHLDDASWSGFIVERIANALKSHGLETRIDAPMLSPPKSRRRATMQAERRGRQIQLGFSEARSHQIVDLQQCEILAPELFRLLHPLRLLLAVLMPRTGRVTIGLTLADQGTDLEIGGIEAAGLAAAEGMTAFASRHGLARLSIDSGIGPETRWEPEPVTITLGGVPVPLPPGAFLQATPEGEAALVAAARAAVGDAATVADLFAGLGTFTLAFPPPVKVYAAEAARDALGALTAAARQAQRPVFAEHRDLYRRPLTTAELNRFEAVVIDPPRAGAKEQIAELAASIVPRIAYVSCNPSTFARDAEVLSKAGHRLDWVRPVGQFRWSTHVELAASFSR